MQETVNMTVFFCVLMFHKQRDRMNFRLFCQTSMDILKKSARILPAQKVYETSKDGIWMSWARAKIKLRFPSRAEKPPPCAIIFTDTD